jgi:hypothetical protein
MPQAERSRVRVPDVVDFFQFISSFQPHYVPGIDSACNRNEYQESSWGVKDGRCIRLKTLAPSVSRFSRYNVGASVFHSHADFHGLLQGYLYFLYLKPQTSWYLHSQWWSPGHLHRCVTGSTFAFFVISGFSFSTFRFLMEAFAS